MYHIKYFKEVTPHTRMYCSSDFKLNVIFLLFYKLFILCCTWLLRKVTFQKNLARIFAYYLAGELYILQSHTEMSPFKI